MTRAPALAPAAIADRLRAAVGAGVDRETGPGMVTVTVPPQAWAAALACARDELGCDFFDWLTGVDELDAGVAVLAHVYSLEGRHHLMLRTLLAGEQGLATATGLYRGAAWHERETHEMFGVRVRGAPRTRAPAAPRRLRTGAVAEEVLSSPRGATATGRARRSRGRPLAPGGAAAAGARHSRRVARLVSADLPARSRGVIGLLEENCTVCMLCARECPDWCIYIESHKEPVPGRAVAPGVPEPARRAGRRVRNALDRFAIDFSLCMYCGICIEVCPYDALFWSPEFSYAETGPARPDP